MIIACTAIASLLVGFLAGLMQVRKLPPHPEHCAEVTWCTQCGQPTGNRCAQHKTPGKSTLDPAEHR